MKLKYVILIAIGFVLCNNSFAQTPKLPFKDFGACPFECCQYRAWTANKDTVIYKEMRDNSSVAFQIKRREKVTGLTGVVITTKSEQVKALKNFMMDNGKIPIKKGDILYTLTYRGEGFYLISYKGKNFDDEIFDEAKLKVLSQPKSVWWVKIKNRKGQIGWTRLPENFDNMDACG
jgi:hypothetical protein